MHQKFSVRVAKNKVLRWSLWLILFPGFLDFKSTSPKPENDYYRAAILIFVPKIASLSRN